MSVYVPALANANLDIKKLEPLDNVKKPNKISLLTASTYNILPRINPLAGYASFVFRSDSCGHDSVDLLSYWRPQVTVEWVVVIEFGIFFLPLE